MITITDPARSLILHDNELRFYDVEGYLYLPGLISRELAEAMREEVLHIMAESGAPLERLRRAESAADKLRQTTQYLEGSRLDAMINSPNLRAIASQLMRGPAILYMPFTAVKNGGGGGRFHFHQDNQYTRFEGPGINIWFALERMMPENGCLQVVPRSHLRGTLEADVSGDGDTHRRVKIEPQDFLPLRMEPGDAVAFTRLTVHGSGPNMTGEPRIGYAVQYHREDVWASRDGQRFLLKESPRYRTAPVKKIEPPKQKSLDGH